jgi:hypothetical protein
MPVRDRERQHEVGGQLGRGRVTARALRTAGVVALWSLLLNAGGRTLCSAVMPASGADRRPAAVQALLTDLFRAPVAVERWERLEPWAIARVLFGGLALPGRLS